MPKFKLGPVAHYRQGLFYEPGSEIVLPDGEKPSRSWYNADGSAVDPEYQLPALVNPVQAPGPTVVPTGAAAAPTTLSEVQASQPAVATPAPGAAPAKDGGKKRPSDREI